VQISVVTTRPTEEGMASSEKSAPKWRSASAQPAERKGRLPSSTTRKRATLLLVASAISMGGAEIVVRMLDIGPEIAPVYAGNYRLASSPRLRYELVPGSPDGAHSINSFGMRDREYPVAKPPNTIRVACIGDSICYGFRVQREETFSARLEELLNGEPGREGVATFEVLNFGVTGYSFTQIMENLREKVLPFEPDLILYAYCLNDPQEYSLEMEGLLAQLTRAEKGYLLPGAWSGWAPLQRSRLYLLSRYVIGSMTREGAQKERAPVPFEDDRQLVAIREGTYAQYYTGLHVSPATWSPVGEGLRELERWSEASGVPVQVTVFPILRDLDAYPLRELHENLLRTFSGHSFHAFDLLDYFQAYERRTGRKLGHTLHPSADGHLLAAAAMAQDLLDARLLPALDERGIRRRLDSERFRHVQAIVNQVRANVQSESPP